MINADDDANKETDIAVIPNYLRVLPVERRATRVDANLWGLSRV